MTPGESRRATPAGWRGRAATAAGTGLVCLQLTAIAPAGQNPARPASAAPPAGAVTVQVPALQVPVPPPPRRPGLQPVPVTELERQPAAATRPFSFSFPEPIGIRDLLLLMVRDTGFSLVIAPGVQGTFVGELKNVTLAQALDLVLAPLSLQHSIDGRVIRVFERRLETRIFHVNYVATRRAGSRELAADTGIGRGDNSLAPGGSAAAAGPAPPAGGAGGSRASVSASDENDLFGALQAGLQMLVSPEGRFNVDRKAGLVQVTDDPERLDRVALYLETVETRVTRQVQIQAKVIEVELADAFPYGIDWTAVLRYAGDSLAFTSGPVPGTLAGPFTRGVRIRDVTGLLNALAMQGRVNVLSSPHVVAMNNEPAVMRVGTEDVYFVTTSQVDAATGRVLQTTTVPRSITEGVVLSVTPQISADGVINMSLSPRVTDRTGQVRSRFGDTVPVVAVRETDTLVRVREGETVVISGLMRDRPAGRHKVPVLGDVPIFGPLFQFGERPGGKADLVILLTPTVLSAGGASGSGRRIGSGMPGEPGAGM